MLARALSHDLPMEAMRDLWLDNADVTVLLSPEARAGAWSKWFLQAVPLGRGQDRHAAARSRDLEVRQKLSLFVRSRWFRPPLDGRIMAGLMYDAVTSMGAPRQAARVAAAVRPYARSVRHADRYLRLPPARADPRSAADPRARSPPRAAVHLSAAAPTATVESDFELDNAPALAFAARATSSFPGAFPPARIVEMDEVVAQRQAHLAAARGVHRQGVRSTICAPTSIRRSTSVHRRRGAQQPAVPAGDRGDPRPAGLPQVDRRLVYIEPHPAPPVMPSRQQDAAASSPRCAARMSDIPSSQPVTDELDWVIEFNDRVRRLRAIIDSARPQVSRLVAEVLTDNARPARSRPQEVRGWREQVNAQVARDAGFAYQAYVRLKLASVRAFGAQLIVKLRGAPAQSPLARVVAEIIDAWAVRKGIVYERADSARARVRDRRPPASAAGLGDAICSPSTSNIASAGCIS